MKTIKRILLFIIFCISGIITSQNERSIHELFEVLSENHMGSVTDVFTLEELQIIKNHYTETNIFKEEVKSVVNIRYSSSESVATPINVTDINPNNLSAVEILAASPMTAFPGAGANLRGIGLPRVLVIDDDGNAWRRDPGNNPGNITNLGLIDGIPPGHSITGIEVLPGPTSELYGISTNGVDESFLLAIDPNNLTATTIGDNNGLVLPISLACDEADRLILIDIDDDHTYSCDKETGVVSMIAPLGYDANFGQGLCYDQYSDKVVSLAYNPAVGDSEMRYIDPVTGNSSLVGTIQPGTVQQFGWGSAYDRDEVLTINENSIDGFSFYPNPSNNTINLNASKTIESIEIYSMVGQLVIKDSGSNVNLKVDVSKLQSGYYVLKVISNNQSGVYKFIKE